MPDGMAGKIVIDEPGCSSDGVGAPTGPDETDTTTSDGLEDGLTGVVLGGSAA
jgi:hypothetical protein